MNAKILNGYSKNLAWVILSLIILAGCKRAGESPSNSTPLSHHNPGDYFHTQFQDESQFIVESIVTDLAEQVFYAKRHQLPAADHFSVQALEKSGSPRGAPVYDLKIALDAKIPELDLELNVSGPIWSPEVYRDVTAALAKALALDPSPALEAEDIAWLQPLTDGSAVTIEKTDRTLSTALAGDFNNPHLHQQAALLLGVFSLRDHSRPFHDLRLPLCRITAHLAMAQYLADDKPPGINASLAEAMALTLMGNEKAALSKLGGITTTNDSVLRWVRVLESRNTGDYRALATVKSPTLIETVAWFQAYYHSANQEVAWSKVENLKTNQTDFCRIAENDGFTVGIAHDIVQNSLQLEMQEVSDIYQESQDHGLNPADAVKVLNAPPERCFNGPDHGRPQVRIIGWGQWAHFLQRHVCAALMHDFESYASRWGLPDDAKNFADYANTNFSGMTLYPFVEVYNATDSASYHKGVDGGFKATVETPQFVPPQCWNRLCYKGPNREVYIPVSNPHVNEWHKHNPPPGTVYDVHPRLDHPSLTDHSEIVPRLHEMAPYNMDIIWHIDRTAYKDKPTREQAMKLLHEVLPFNPNAMRVAAWTIQDQPEQYEGIMTNAVKLDPGLYYVLGDYYIIQRKDMDKAAECFEQGAAQDPDSLVAANYASWRIKYYLKKGQKETAREVADAAGDVYSGYGLMAKAEYFEATGDDQQALEWYQKNEERYRDSRPLIMFIARHKARTGDTKFDESAQTGLKQLFPKGIEKVSLKDFQGPPKDGAYILDDTELIKAAGLAQGNIIVAINGVRIHNFPQYEYGRELVGDPELDLIVWQGGQYIEVKTSPPNHMFGSRMDNYPRK